MAVLDPDKHDTNRLTDRGIVIEENEYHCIDHQTLVYQPVRLRESRQWNTVNELETIATYCTSPRCAS
jgi:hypothetical protein